MKRVSTLVSIHRFYDRLRAWRYRSSTEVADVLRVIEFRDLARSFYSYSGLRPILTTANGLFTRTERGFFLRYEPSDQCGKLWGIEKTGTWEEECVSWCVDIMKRGGTFIDVGANVGYYSLAVAFDAPAAKVIAFEPIKNNFDLLESNIEINKLDAIITAYNLGLAADNTTASMVVQHQLSRVVASEDNGKHPTEEVLMVTLDSHCLKHAIDNVKLIKCDVEGFELFVLKGARNILIEQRPLLLIEIEDRWTRRYGYGIDNIVSFLNTIGYKQKASTGWNAQQASYLNSMFVFVNNH